MKKILIDSEIYAKMKKGGSIMDRANVKVLTAKTNDELLALHRSENANLIITRLEAGGMSSESLFEEIRSDAKLRTVALLLFCDNHEKARAERCAPNAVMTLPVNSALLFEKAQSFLNVSSRGAYRVLLSVTVDAAKEKPFFCKSENISVTGLLLEADRDLAVGEQLHCAFFLPGSKRIEVAGEIARVIDAGGKTGAKKYGVKFTGITPGDSIAIDSFVRQKTAAH